MARENILKVIIGADDKTQAAFKSATANATKFGAVVTGALAGAVTMSAKFETGMAEIQTLLGKDATPEVQKMAGELKALSVQSGQTLGALTKARYDIISAGFADGAEGAEVMTASVNVARGGLVDVATAADLMTSALNGMGLGAEDAASAADDLFTIVRLGKTTMGELAQGMGKVFATAKVAGVSLDEVGAAMAVITAAGIDTQEAATALNQLFVALAAPSGEAKDALEELGITLENGLGPALQGLAQASGEGLDKLRQLVPNIRALKAAAAAGNDIDAFNDALAEFADNSGAATEAVEIMADTLGEQMKVLRQQLQVLAVEIGQMLMPVARGLVDALTGIVETVRELPDGLQSATVGFTAMAGAVALLAGALGTMALHLDAVVKVLPLIKGSAFMSALASGGVIAAAASIGTIVIAGAADAASQATAAEMDKEGLTWWERFMAPPDELQQKYYREGRSMRFSTPYLREGETLDVGDDAFLAGMEMPYVPMSNFREGLDPEEVRENMLASAQAATRERMDTAAYKHAEAMGTAASEVQIYAEELVKLGATMEEVTPLLAESDTSAEALESRPAATPAPVLDAMLESGDTSNPYEEYLNQMADEMEPPTVDQKKFDEMFPEQGRVSDLAAEWEEFGYALSENIVGNATALSDAMGQAIVYGEDFGEAMTTALKSIAAQIVAMIIQFIAFKVVLKSIFASIGGPFGFMASLFGSGTAFVPHQPQPAMAGFATGTGFVPH